MLKYNYDDWNPNRNVCIFLALTPLPFGSSTGMKQISLVLDRYIPLRMYEYIFKHLEIMIHRVKYNTVGSTPVN